MKSERARGRLPFSAPSIRVALLACTPLALVGCGVHGTHPGYSGPPVFHENEPNGSSDHPDFIGGVDGSSHFVIEGSVDAFGPDWLDGFAFVADEPLTFAFELRATNGAADIDAFLYDPLLDETVAWFDSTWDPEVGSFTVLEPGKEFHLVVETYDADTSYSLEVWGEPVYFNESAGDPGAGASPAGSFGLSPDVRAPRKIRRAMAAYGQPPVAALEDEVRVLGHGFVLASDGSVETLQSFDLLLTGDRRTYALRTGGR